MRLKKSIAAFALMLSVLATTRCRSVASVGYRPANETKVERGMQDAARRAPNAQPSSAIEKSFQQSVPLTAQTVADFAPQGWYMVKTAEGDLNDDSRPDAAAVFSKVKNDVGKRDAAISEEDLAAPRILVLALRGENGQLQRAGESWRAVLCRQCGGMFDEPLLDLKIERGAFVIEQAVMGAGTEKTYVHRFRYKDEEWLLIGETIESIDRKTGDSRSKDENYLTGLVVSETGKASDELPVRRTHRVPVSKPQPLPHFDINKVDVANGKS